MGDYNLDGHTDLVKTHFLDQAPGIYSNDGKGNFDDVTTQAGLNNETRFVCFGAGLVDFDNDGYPDILISTGSVYPELDAFRPGMPAAHARASFFAIGETAHLSRWARRPAPASLPATAAEAWPLATSTTMATWTC